MDDYNFGLYTNSYPSDPAYTLLLNSTQFPSYGGNFSFEFPFGMAGDQPIAWKPGWWKITSSQIGGSADEKKEVDGKVADHPTNYSISAYPNPFNPTTSFQYDLPKNSSVSLEVYNLLGQRVQTLVQENQLAGTYRISFNAGNLPSGIYLYHLKANSLEDKSRFEKSGKLMLLK